MQAVTHAGVPNQANDTSMSVREHEQHLAHVSDELEHLELREIPPPPQVLALQSLILPQQRGQQVVGVPEASPSSLVLSLGRPPQVNYQNSTNRVACNQIYPTQQ